MKDQDKHHWKPIEPDKYGNKRKKCTRGDCGCIMTIFYYKKFKLYIYERGSMIYRSYRPNCFGDIPISEQNNIDE